MTDGDWEHFEHGADIGVRGCGPTVEAAFEQAALALTAVIVDPARVAPRTEVAVLCEAADLELLLVDWLNALIFEMASRRMVFGVFDVRIKSNRLAAKARGEVVDRDRHAPAVEVKGATYTELRVDTRDGRWCAQCVVDV